jgi:hypothetical protein
VTVVVVVVVVVVVEETWVACHRLVKRASPPSHVACGPSRTRCFGPGSSPLSRLYTHRPGRVSVPLQCRDLLLHARWRTRSDSTASVPVADCKRHCLHPAVEPHRRPPTPGLPRRKASATAPRGPSTFNCLDSPLSLRSCTSNMALQGDRK